MRINNGSDVRWKYLLLTAVVLASSEATFLTSFGQEILLYSQQPYYLTNNSTLVAEDVDPHAGVVWLKLYSDNQTLKSALVGVGDRFAYNNRNLTVSKIYAGGDHDLVELKINNSDNSSNSNSSFLNLTQRRNPLNITEIGPKNTSMRSQTSLKSPSVGVWAVFLAILVRRFIGAR